MPTVTGPASAPAASPDPLCTGHAHPCPHGSLSSLSHVRHPWANVTAFLPKLAQVRWTPPGSPGGPSPVAVLELGGPSRPGRASPESPSTGTGSRSSTCPSVISHLLLSLLWRRVTRLPWLPRPPTLSVLTSSPAASLYTKCCRFKQQRSLPVTVLRSPDSQARAPANGGQIQPPRGRQTRPGIHRAERGCEWRTQWPPSC